MKPIIPTEFAEQCSFVDWLEFRGLRYSAIPNSTYTPGWGAKMRNKRMGVRPGVPDLLVVIPKRCLVFVEMKRTKGGTVSKEQKEWIEALNEVNNVEAKVCYGFDEAVKFIESI
jgi:hypothetical protein